MNTPIDPALLDALCRFFLGEGPEPGGPEVAALVQGGIIKQGSFWNEVSFEGVCVLVRALRLSQLRCAWLEKVVAAKDAQCDLDRSNGAGTALAPKYERVRETAKAQMEALDAYLFAAGKP